ncbi:aspartate carbamoyltransferase [Actinomadura rudentiformis]|uniref:Aspartate carbamoyltransferase n=1 Tax=Actinomadura rudentiformis TaxID=359158 RepID=A0A6H9YUN7_9ACTN|nr:aspartate carbamoyltransferase [Actinomadura rudentiformis]KAB2352231.1 aspartate carbamoyltransferase [Actinomadura rudentiformis]
MNLKNRRTWLLVAAPVVIALSSAATYAIIDRNEQQQPPAARQSEIAAKSRQVMPFDLDRTTHRFTKTATGGVQTVTADDQADAQQIKLIREHLTEEAAAFRKGDYGDPASIHGGQMPGLRELEQGHTRIETRYTQTPSGAQITYTTSDPSLIKALHAWFDAQVTDHGQHAEHG